MGNAILRQLKDYDKSVKQTEETILMPEPEPEALEPAMNPFNASS